MVNELLRAIHKVQQNYRLTNVLKECLRLRTVYEREEYVELTTEDMRKKTEYCLWNSKSSTSSAKRQNKPTCSRSSVDFGSQIRLDSTWDQLPGAAHKSTTRRKGSFVSEIGKHKVHPLWIFPYFACSYIPLYNNKLTVILLNFIFSTCLTHDCSGSSILRGRYGSLHTPVTMV